MAETKNGDAYKTVARLCRRVGVDSGDVASDAGGGLEHQDHAWATNPFLPDTAGVEGAIVRNSEVPLNERCG